MKFWQSDDTIKLGLMPPLTGIVSIYGSEISRAAQIACNEINENGGVLGKPLKLIIEDDGSLPDSSVKAAEKLIKKHKCVAMIGNLLSNSRIAVAYQVAEPNKIPYLNFSFYEGSIMSRYFFHFAALPNQQIDLMIPYMQKKFGSRMFFAGNNYEWPRGSIDAAKLSLLKNNGTIVGEEYFPIGTEIKELEKLMDTLSNSNVDVFVPYFAGTDQVNLLTLFTNRKLKDRMAVVMGHYDEMMASVLTPEVRKGFYSSNSYFMSVETPENENFKNRCLSMPRVTGIYPNGNGILTNFGEGAYLCVHAFAKAANLSGSISSESLVETLERISLRSPQGQINMDKETHHSKINSYLAQCEHDGSFTIVEDFGEIEPIIPDRYKHLKFRPQATLESEIRLQARVLEQMTEGVSLTDSKSLKIIFNNRGFEKMYGYENNELYGKNISIIYAPDSSQNISEIIHSKLSRYGFWQGEVMGIKKNGDQFYVSATISIFTHAEFGEVFMAVYKDINDIKRIEKKFRTQYQNFPLPTYTWQSVEDDFILIDYNIAAEKSTKGFVTNLLGKSAITLYAEDQETLESLFKCYTEQVSFTKEMEYFMQSAAEYRLLLVTFVFTHPDLIMIHTEDITARKLAEDTLRNSRNELGLLVQERTAELARVNEILLADIALRKQTEESLQKSEAQFRTMNDASPIGVFVTNIAGECLYTNERYQIISGLSLEQSLGQGWVSGVHADDRKHLFQEWKNATCNKLPFEMTNRFQHSNGDVVWVSVKASVMKVGSEIVGYVGTVEDITLRKKMEQTLLENQHSLKYILTNLITGVLHVNLEGQIVYANKAATEILNIQYDEITQRYFDDPSWKLIYDNGDPYPLENLPLAIAMSERRAVLNMEHGIETNTGERKWIVVNAFPLLDSDGKVQGGIANFINITDRKSAEKDLIKAKEQAEAGNRAKTEFLTTMSHEIRTPLNAVIGFTDLLVKTDLNEIQSKYMGIVSQSANSLLDLLNDILDFSKIEAGRLELNIERIDIIELVMQTSNIIKFKAEEKNIKVILNISPIVPRYLYSDPIRLRQILINLLGNAIKFTKEGEIEISISILNYLESDGNAQFLFSVRDTGIGISKENRQKIFRAFSQEDTSITRKYGGTGLGLAISSKLLALMNSKLELESELGNGSKFYFTLTIKIEQENDQKQNSLPTYGEDVNNHQSGDGEVIQSKDGKGIQFNKKSIKSRQPKILVVDDDETNRLLADSLLSRIIPNAIIFVVDNGEQAIEQFKKEKPDIIFMDIQMPEMNGFETTVEIRKLEIGFRTPIIALTAGTVKEEIENCFLAGMDDYASKPIILDRFKKILNKWLNSLSYADKKSEASKIEEMNRNHFNYSEFKNRFEMSEEILMKVLATASATLTSSIDELKKNFEHKNVNTIQHTAHKIKGTALTICAAELAKLSAELEIKTRFDDAKFPTLIQNIENEIKLIKKMITKNLGE